MVPPSQDLATWKDKEEEDNDEEEEQEEQEEGNNPLLDLKNILNKIQDTFRGRKKKEAKKSFDPSSFASMKWVWIGPKHILEKKYYITPVPINPSVLSLSQQ